MNKPIQLFEPYVSGFVGLPLLTPSQPKAHRSNVMAAVGVVEVVQLELSKRSFSERLDQLYGTIANRRFTNTEFEFVDGYLEESVRVMAINTLNDWIIVQEQSPYFSQSHRDFMEDTLRFIATGKRSLNPAMWQYRLQYHRKEVSAKRYLVNRDLMPEVNALPDVIGKWLSHTGGWSDFILTMAVMYGSVLNNS